MPNAASFEPRKPFAKKLTTSHSARTVTDFVVWRERDTERREIEERTATALDAGALDSAFIEYAAHRNRSPLVRRLLSAVVVPGQRSPSLCVDLLDLHLSDSLRLWRCAGTVGAISYFKRTLPHDMEGMVRALPNVKRARLALALCGLLADPWPKLNRVERAAVLLGMLCKRLQRGGTP